MGRHYHRTIFTKTIYTLTFFVLCSFLKDAQPPQAKISNGLINATLYIPDAKEGYYRAARFDWAGQISQLTYKGHSFFGKWYEKYDPYINDAIMGPVEAFDPIGYNETKKGGTFVKIGVGALEKSEDKDYFFANSYTLVNPGKWEMKKASDKIRFTHTLNDTTISYIYTKTVVLSKDKPELILKHTLKNTGTKPIETNVMNHNFFVIDEQVSGPDFETTFTFEPVVEESTEPRSASISGRQILLEDGDPKGKNFYLGPITGYTNDSADYNITVRNKKTGAAVNIRADQPFAKLAFWATVKTVCPEPFIHVKADPGKEFSWNITYRFSVEK
jgi:hypothetical protein